jgi:NAD(P)-dependent dehydrogenase (short-subunit alcohol dehydrogenase family)
MTGAFSGKTAFVTGGGTGLGLEVSRRLGRAGANVVVASRDVKHHAGIVADGAREGFAVLSIAMDVREHHAVRDAMRAAEKKFGGVDVLVNNAAGNFVRPSIGLPTKAFANVLDVALTGVFTCSREAARVMADRGGAIVNVSAPYASTGKPGVVHSACAKAGVEAMTKTLAAEWAPRIRVNAVSPGPFESAGAADRLWPSEALEEAVRAQIPLGRFGRPAEVAAAIAWLASDEAAWVTGTILVMDGGWSLPQSLLPGDGKVRRRRRTEEPSGS